MIFKRMRIAIEQLISKERSPKKLALTCCLGVYIGFSPFIGFHTVMTFLFGWMFAVNIAVLLTISVLINNPWTMISVYSLDHIFGKWLFKLLSIDSMQLDPLWIESCNLFLKQHTGISGVSLAAFLLGGNLLGMAISVMLYPLIKRVFINYLSKNSLSCKE